MTEEEYLKYVIGVIEEYLEEELESFEELEFRYRRDPERYGIAYKLACNHLKILTNGILKPYFARIDFRVDSSLKKEQFYIGKYGINNEQAQPIVVDWRAPISSLYYDSNLGMTQYECPDGVVSGELLLKRQYEIADGKLINYHDVDIVSHDELLQKYLQVNNDLRLKNIVSTIQAEQNVAIRKPLNKNIIVQGVAGSGKTTIALHRIAYLVYNYREKVRNNQYLVLGPNDVFLKYISSVLPDLDVSDVEQHTFESFAKEIIGENFEINPSSKKLNQYLTGKISDSISQIKNSEDFIVALELFLNNYFTCLIKNGLVIKGFEVLDKDLLDVMYQKALHSSINFENAAEKFSLLVEDYVKMYKENLISNLNSHFYELFSNATTNSEKEKIIKDKKLVYDEISKGCKSVSKRFISKYKSSPLRLYKNFISKILDFGISNPCMADLKVETLKNIKNKVLDFEDLAPLMHISSYLGIDSKLKDYRHVVVDEAQDLGYFNFIVLKECLPNATFSIYGDIAQSIYDYRSFKSWNEIKKIFGNCELLSFRKSYRTTDEIMSVANSVANSLNLEESELSIRHGNQVTFQNLEKDDIPLYIKNKVSEYRAKGYQTIAIISKYPVQSNYLNDDLLFQGLIVPNIDEATDIKLIEKGIYTIPNYLAKGLEFDAVILNDASEQIYDSSKDSDMKMLYVALTRALHEMDIVYSGDITKPLKKFVDEKKLVKGKNENRKS